MIISLEIKGEFRIYLPLRLILAEILRMQDTFDTFDKYIVDNTNLTNQIK